MKRSTPPDSPKLFDPLPLKPDFSIEEAARLEGLWPVAGTDEAGRGPLAGPVVAAAVILDPENIPAGLNDSKKLSLKQREKLFDEIIATAQVSIASSGPKRIDDMNILRASLDAMRRAVAGLETPPALTWSPGFTRRAAVYFQLPIAPISQSTLGKSPPPGLRVPSRTCASLTTCRCWKT